MNSIAIKVQAFLLILSSLFVTKNVSADMSRVILNTDNFTISVNPGNSGFALALASKLELYHDTIASFLEIEIKEKIKVIINPDERISFDYLKSNNELIITENGIIPDYENLIYNQIFLFYLQNLVSGGNDTSVLDEMFSHAMMHYPVTDRKFIDLVISDLVNNSGITSVAFTEIKKYKADVQESIYTALIDFIISSYNKKILIQALKDKDYYNGFYKSLSAITGDSIDSISEKFNTYLQKHKSEISASKQEPVLDSDEYSDVCYSVSGNGKIALLQKNSKSFRLLLKNGSNIVINNLVQSEYDSAFNKIIFNGSDQIVITEILQSGSAIYLYDAAKNIFIDKIFLPYLFLSDITYMNEQKYIFSADCGLTSDIYSLDLNKRKFTILTETGNNYSPSVINDKVLFVSIADKSSINELNVSSGDVKTLYSTEQKISGLSKVDSEKLIFSSKLNGINCIYILNLQSGNLLPITDDITSSIMPFIYNKNIYYLSFFKSKYRLFSSDFNPSDI